MHLRENVALGRLTTLGVGGPARYFVAAASTDEVREAVSWARERGQPLFVLGGGSNLVVADAGFPGLVLKIEIPGIVESLRDGRRTFEVGAGVDWDTFVACAVAADCSGVECLSGIPGTVGGTPVQNVGAYGQEVSGTITSVRALEVATLEVREFSNAECGFAYRTSRFNTVDRGSYIILRVTYALEPHGAAKLDYADLKKFFGNRPSSNGGGPTLAEVREAVCQIRLSKSMLITEGDPDARSAGSFFKNPILPRAEAERIVKWAEQRGLRLTAYPVGTDLMKVSAAWLIEQSGLHKGFALGPMAISSKHTLALVNRGGAKASDVLEMKSLVQARVREAFGVELTPEPVFVGFAPVVAGPLTPKS
jgi:UDP-N-acetylmuramate dehydrogenase